jgi:hypothetical protein
MGIGLQHGLEAAQKCGHLALTWDGRSYDAGQPEDIRTVLSRFSQKPKSFNRRTTHGSNPAREEA